MPHLTHSNRKKVGTCHNCGSNLTYMLLDNKWFCDECLVKAINAGTYTLIEGLPPISTAVDPGVEVEWE